MRRTAAIAVCALAIAMSPAHAEQPVAESGPGLTTPELIEREVAAGALDRRRADLLLAGALTGAAVPPRYRSDLPWDGTLVLLDLQRRLRGMEPGEPRRELRKALASGEASDVSTCGGHAGGPPSFDSAHFHIDYTNIGGSLDINDYAASLEASWNSEVGSLGWAAPPQPPIPAPGGRYHVVVSEILGPTTYGLTANSGSHAGSIGNNPNTPWNDGDAVASCIVLNDDYTVLSGLTGSTEQQALDATTSHEFAHALQFGYGGLNGSNLPDPVFIEGGATWMEDEVFDGSNDNYHYLWPDLADDMGDHDGSPYRYWVVWRAMLERFGTNVPNGGERVMQRFWEITSREEGDTLTAMGKALEPEGLSLADAFHHAAVAVRFSRSCGGGSHCLEEGDQYAAAEGTPPSHGAIGGVGSNRSASLPDNYSAHFIDLPTGMGTVQVILANDSPQAGRFRGSVVCDTGSSLSVTPFTGTAAGGEHVYARSVSTGGCARASIVVTNVAEAEPNPDSSSARPYTLSVTPPAARSRTTVRGKADGGQVEVRGRVRPRQPGGEVDLTLFERRNGKWRKAKRDQVDLRRGKRFEATFPRPNASRCRIEAAFEGDDNHLPSRRARRFPC